MPTTVPLRFFSHEPTPRAREPVTVGLPWPRGLVKTERQFRLAAPPGEPAALQAQVLARWPDGSVKWCLFDFLATTPASHDGDTTAGYAITVADTTDPRVEQVMPPKLPPIALEFADAAGAVTAATLAFGPPTESGPVRARLPFRFDLPGGLVARGWFDWFRAAGRCHAQVTLTNPHAADHPGGNWDLGNGGSREFASLSVRVPVARRGGEARFSPERGRPTARVGLPLTLHQESSGGENWRSTAHVDRSGRVNLDYRGCRLTTPQFTADALRATPVVSVLGLALGVPEFWQNFPMALRADERHITLDLLPTRPGQLHELQGGEQKSWQFRFGVQAEPAGLRSPLYCSAAPEWYCASGALPHLTPEAGDPHTHYVKLARQAIDGPDTFLRKREVIDEYGWRQLRRHLRRPRGGVFHKGSDAADLARQQPIRLRVGVRYEQFFRSQ